MSNSDNLPPSSPGHIEVDALLTGVRSILAPLLKRRQPSPADFDAAIERLTELSAAALGVERASLWRFDSARQKLVCLDLFATSQRRHSKGVEIDVTSTPRYLAALAGGGAIAAHDAQRDPRTSEFTESYLVPNGITAMLDASVLVEGSMRGMTCNEHIGTGARRWAGIEVLAALTLADLAAFIIGTSENAEKA